MCEFDIDYINYRNGEISKMRDVLKSEDMNKYILNNIKYIVNLRKRIKKGLVKDVNDVIMRYLSIRDILILLDKEGKYKIPSVNLFQSKCEILIYKKLYSLYKLENSLCIYPQRSLKLLNSLIKRNLSVDFYCEIGEMCVVIEFDGEHHYEIDSYYYKKSICMNDIIKDIYLIDNNISIIRVDKISINYFLENICEYLLKIKNGKLLNYNYHEMSFLECDIDSVNNMEINNINLYNEKNIDKYYNNYSLLKEFMRSEYNLNEIKLKKYEKIYDEYKIEREKIMESNKKVMMSLYDF